ncbi:MAG: AsmA-like C-terminal region-containing protein, partial [Gammaproteobacteria bacterium]|nr:AsmA-like C-terminal region-containing protein [Gammaproteobacteria bacterium]
DPGVGATIPVAGYLAAGPTVGAALLLASQILKTPLSDITQVKYKITGSWEDPVIEEVEAPPTEKQE